MNHKSKCCEAIIAAITSDEEENCLRDYPVTICDGCIGLKGEMCDTPGCAFIRCTTKEIKKLLNQTQISPLIDGKQICIIEPIEFDRVKSPNNSQSLDDRLDLLLFYIHTAPKLGFEHAKKKVISEILDLLSQARQEERDKVIKEVAEEFDVFLCCVGRCEHKGKGESGLFLSAKKQIIETLEAKQKILNPNQTNQNE